MSLDTVTSWVERPVRRVSGSDRFNPLPHAGTISVFLLIVVVVSGLYITLFFQYGYEASYESVLRMEQHPIQRVIRALHRYSSAALVVTTVVHGWRIFVAGRFKPRRRRWRWMTGVATLLVVWPAGVTGYLLIWDVRAGSIADAVGRTVGFVGAGTALWVRHLSGSGSGSGSTFFVVVWLAHLGLTVVVGWFALRHLRRSKLAWLPPRRWMLAMGGALTAVSIVVPVGMLDPFSGERIGENLPLDPFVLFLLPVLDSDWRWVGVAGLSALATGVAVLPFVLGGRGNEPAPVQVHEDACTGCELCVLDCPYDALSMVEGDGDRPIAAVDATACTSCGICLGSCAFDALTLDTVPGSAGGESPFAGQDIEGRCVVVACDRHAAEVERLATGPFQLVRCAGVVGPGLVKKLASQGVASVDIVGCAADDCRYGVGNTLAEARIRGEHAPHIPRSRQSLVTSRWSAIGDLGSPPASSSGATGRDRATGDDDGGDGEGGDPEVGNRRTLVGSSVLVVASVVAIAMATAAPFRGESTDAAVRVTVDQDPTVGLADDRGFVEPVDSIDLRVDSRSLGPRSTSRWRGNVVAVEDWRLEPRSAMVEVVAAGGGREVVVFSGQVELAPNQRLEVPIRSLSLAPIAEVGREVFEARRSGCAVCHSVEPDENRIGPSLYGVATRAESRVEGLDASTYLWQSILLPDEYIVEGYPKGQMLPIYQERLSQEELDALIAYLLTLTDESTEEGTP